MVRKGTGSKARTPAAMNIRHHYVKAGRPPAGSAAHKQAIAIGLSEARKGKVHR